MHFDKSSCSLNLFVHDWMSIFGGNCMQTLYVRIFMTTLFIMFVSAFIGFLLTNLFYHFNLKPKNDEKTTEIAESVVNIYEQSDHEDIHQYLASMAHLGYTFILFEEEHRAKTYGVPIDVQKIPDGVAASVFAGEVYHGIRDYPWHPFVTGFFNNEITNTVGVPVRVDGEVLALRSEEHTSELQSRGHLVCRLLLEKKKYNIS